jgi:hypothetical protein
MSHNHGGTGMAGMSMGELPPLEDFPKFYWAVVGSAIGVATLVNVFNYILYTQRYARFPPSAQSV